MIGEQLAGRSRLRIPVAAETEIYKGDFVAINADGYAVKVSKTEGLLNAGVAVSDANNVTGSVCRSRARRSYLRKCRGYQGNGSAEEMLFCRRRQRHAGGRRLQ